MIETTRLILRNFLTGDAEKCFKSWGQDKLLGKFIALYPMKNLQEMRSFVDILSRNDDAWLVCLKDGTPVGYVSVDIPYPQLGVGEIGYVIGECFQRKGYAKEAVIAVLKEYLINRNMYLIEAKCSEDNRASQILLDSIGFLEEAALRGRRIDNESGNRRKLLIFSITSDEMKKKQKE